MIDALPSIDWRFMILLHRIIRKLAEALATVPAAAAARG